MHNEAHVTRFTCAEGWGVAFRTRRAAGLFLAQVKAPHSGTSARFFSVPVSAQDDLLQLQWTLPPLCFKAQRSVDSRKLQMHKNLQDCGGACACVCVCEGVRVHVQCRRVQMLYKHMLYEWGHFCQTLKVM